MNRIILIGNGFDLAHGMDTRYQDFIADYWKNVTEKIKKLKRKGLFENTEIRIERCRPKYPMDGTYEDLIKALTYFNTCIIYENRFLKIINDNNSLNKWVDIEGEYYRLLKESIENQDDEGAYNIEDLNRDFKVIKDKLTDYLEKVERKFIESSESELKVIKDAIGTKLYQPIDFSNSSELALNELAKQELAKLRKESKILEEDPLIKEEDFSEARLDLIRIVTHESNPLDIIKNKLRDSNASEYFYLNPENILFLNFNYTDIHNQYNNPQRSDYFWEEHLPVTNSISIHGSIYDQEKNPIVFGFGDELDEEYKDIENLNDNRYLENIKSINYLESGSYKSLLQYIESGYYEIFILGHSCGISDRTLLNTMFEHNNCASIKVFYRERENGSDNYSDIVRNISRNFNDKAKMRDRVVNKVDCKPLVEGVVKE